MNIISEIKTKFGEKVGILERSRRRIYIEASTKTVAKELVGYMFKELGARMSIITAVDTRGGIELLYHMAFDREGFIISIRVIIKKPDLKISTITDIIEGAEWIEREIHEMFGVDFLGHPNLKKLLLPDDWPEGEYPFRKKSYDSETEVKETNG